MKKKTISVVVPVYNSGKTLGLLCERLKAVLSRCATAYEILLVNDGSRDDSWGIIRRLSEDPRIRGIDLLRNYGQHNALLCGIRAARFEIVVTIDDDLQHPPEELPRLLEKLEECDVVYGTPEREKHGLFRDLASRITKIAMQASMGVEAARHISAFRAFHARVRGAFDQYRGAFVSIDVLLTWGAERFAWVPVRHDARKTGRSNYTFRKLIIHALNMITGFSIFPLQIASMVGFVFAFFGLVVFLYVVGRYVIQGTSVPGFPFLASIIAIFSGVQLLTIGMIGEYLARVHFRIMDKPSYMVRETAGGKERRDSKQRRKK